MVTHSSILTCRIPWTEESGGLQSMGSQIVSHDWVTKTATTMIGLFLVFWKTFILWFHKLAVPIYIPPTMYKVYLFSTSSPISIFVLFDNIHMTGTKWYLIVVLIYISLMISKVEHVSHAYWLSAFPPWKNVHIVLIPIFHQVIFFLLIYVWY